MSLSATDGPIPKGDFNITNKNITVSSSEIDAKTHEVVSKSLTETTSPDIPEKIMPKDTSPLYQVTDTNEIPIQEMINTVVGSKKDVQETAPGPGISFDEEKMKMAFGEGDVAALREMGKDIVNWRGPNGETLLHHAWSPQLMEFCLEIGCNPDAQDQNGMTPLHYAMNDPDIVCLDILTKKASNLQPTNHEGKTPLQHVSSYVLKRICSEAVNSGSIHLIDSLCRMGIDPIKGIDPEESSKTESILKFAIEANNPKMVKQIIDFVDWKDFEDEELIGIFQSSFFDAIMKDNPHMVKVFLEKNDNRLELQTYYGDSPLEFAESRGKLNAYAALFKYEQGNANFEESRSIHFLDENKLLMGFSDEINPNFVEWYKNQAGMLEFIKGGAEISNEAKEKLMMLALHAYSKGANITAEDAVHHNTQISPLFSDEIRYHRSTENSFIYFLENAFWPNERLTKKEFYRFGEVVPEDNTFSQEHFLVNSPLFAEVIAREFSGVLRKVENREDIEKLVLELQENPPEGVIIVEGLNKIEKEDQSLLDQYSSNMIFIECEKKGDFDVLFLPSSYAEDQNLSNEKMRSLISSHGFVLSPDKLKEGLSMNSKEMGLETNGIETVFDFFLQKQGLSPAILSTKGTQTPIVCRDFNELLSRNAYKTFRNLSKNEEAPPYLQILPEATCLLLEGLKDRGVDSAFQEEGLQDLLQITYHKIIDSLASANHNRDNMGAFQNNIEQIHQEIQNILAILSINHGAKPTDLAESILAGLTAGEHPIIPKDLSTPSVSLKASAMRCLSSTLAGIESEKGSGNLNILMLKDCYYESSGVIHDNKSYNTTVFDGDKFAQGDPNLWLEQKMPEQKSIDLFICEVHHNISLSRTEYHKEEITKQVLDLHNKGVLADKCTVLIDTTMDLENSPDMRELFNNPEIKKLVSEGKLNIVLIRSGHKLNLMGMDNYFGGISITTNQPQSFNKFNSRMEDSKDQLEGLNYEGFAHFADCLGSMTDDYRLAISKNTQQLYDSLPVEMKMNSSNTNPIQFATINDENPIFLHMLSGEFNCVLGVFTEYFKKTSLEQALPITLRPSFGFSNMNFVLIPDPETGRYKTRISPGLEGPRQIQHYQEALTKFQEVLTKALEQTKEEKENSVRDLKVAELMRGELLPVIKADNV